MALSVSDWIEGYRVAWETRDAEAVAALFSEDATYRDHILKEPHQGRAGVAAYWTEVTSPQVDPRVQMGRPFTDGGRVAVEFWARWKTDDGDVTLPGCLLLDFDEDGLCRRLREYWLYEPGDYEPPAEWGT